VFWTGADPVRTGIVPSLSRPGGNITGITPMDVDLGAKRLGVLHELLPRTARIGVLVNPSNQITQFVIPDLLAAAVAIGRQVELFNAASNGEIDAAFAGLAQKRADALLLTPETLFATRRAQLVTLAARYAVPVMYWQREFVEIGGLMSYGAPFTDQYRQVGLYVGRILKGEKPADLPVMRATKFEFVINLQTAKLLRLDVPPTLLSLADEVIE
jgi:putative ABC transport system substrate-binding protein